MIVRLLFRATENVTKRSRTFEKCGKQLYFLYPRLVVQSFTAACVSHFEENFTIDVNKNFPLHVL